MKALYLIPADDASRDAESSQISIHKIINEISSQGFPVLLNRIAFFMMIDLDESEQQLGEFELSYELLLNETALFPGSSVTVKPDKKLRAQVTLKLLGMLIPSSGDLTLVISKEGNELIRTSIKISQTPEAGE